MVTQTMSIDDYFIPRNVKDALLLLEKGEKGYYILSGGTSLAFSKPKGIKGIVDLSRSGLDYIKKQKDGIHIGAATPVSELIKNPLFSSYFGGVAKEAALNLATTPLRNLITIGGNVLRIYLWSNLPVLFLSLGARFKTASKNDDAFFEADEFFSSQPLPRLKNGRILKEIILPPDDKAAKGAFLKFSLTKTDFALLNVAAVLWIRKGKCTKARIAIGAASPLPMRLIKAEEVLTNAVLTQEVISTAAKVGAQSIKPLRDFRVSDDYKSRIAPALIESCLISAWKKFHKDNA
ncbi:FAD binding domain-containing protein [Candidatus Sumerlaeota bacterium]|nr:FAD binding domain-containing protein [Candidatus Sumerlaeota bacterium]